MNNAIIYIVIGAVCDTFGDLLMKNWVLNSSKLYFIAGMCFYVVGLGFLAFSFTTKNMVVASVLFLIFNIVLLTLINCFWFNEALTSKQIVAIMFGITAVILFEFN
ncbi:hypothetical protein [Lacinutrix chionoecetis]